MPCRGVERWEQVVRAHVGMGMCDDASGIERGHRCGLQVHKFFVPVRLISFTISCNIFAHFSLTRSFYHPPADLAYRAAVPHACFVAITIIIVITTAQHIIRIISRNSSRPSCLGLTQRISCFYNIRSSRTAGTLVCLVVSILYSFLLSSQSILSMTSASVHTSDSCYRRVVLLFSFFPGPMP